MTRLKVLLIALCGFTLMATGCLKLFGKSIENSVKTLSEGLNKIDPVALKTLVAENAELRDNLREIRHRSMGLSLGMADITLKDRRIVLRVPENTGDFIVTTWIDEKQNWAWKDRRFIDQQQVLKVDDDANFMLECHNNFNANAYICAGQKPHWAANVLSTIQNHTDDEIAPAFRKFAKDSPLTLGPDERDIEIGEAHLTTGEHAISYQVTPFSSDSNGRWALRGQLVVISENNTEFIQKQFDLRSEDYPGHALNTPLPVQTMRIHVKAAN